MLVTLPPVFYAVAKELARRGFGSAYVIAGGFQAWTNSKLKTKLSSTVGGWLVEVFVEVLVKVLMEVLCLG